MQNLHSIWLVPQENDEKQLNEFVDRLADKYSAPRFTPHLTLFPGIEWDIKKLESITNTVTTSQKPLTVKKIGIGQSDFFFKTVFIEIELSKELTDLYNKLSYGTDGRNISEFKPHISLIYKALDEKTRLDIVKNINVNNEFRLDKVFIVAPKEGDEDYFDVKNWRIPYKKTLNDL